MKSSALIIIVMLFSLSIFSCQEAPPTEATLMQPTPSLHVTAPIPTETRTPPTETQTEVPEPTVTEEPTPTGFELGDERIRSEDSMVMVYVPSGGFRMGSTSSDLDYAFVLCQEYYGEVYGPCERRWWQNEQPGHSVRLEPYWIDAYEVSNSQYRKCVETGACDPPSRDTYFGDHTFDDHPVVYVNWYQAVEYCDWAVARLPTEAELEYATRGPDNLRFPWGNQFDGNRVNYCDVNCEYDWADDSVDDGYGRTSPVGSYPDGVSWSGAFDLVGNVWEWAQDWYDATYFSQSNTDNPTGPDSGVERVRRGGSWHYSADGVRGTSRFGVGPSNADSFQGFRCASNLD
jgi:formylglycine-generating enzyme required for sulfatase activity